MENYKLKVFYDDNKSYILYKMVREEEMINDGREREDTSNSPPCIPGIY
jgi:hypothetical protein